MTLRAWPVLGGILLLCSCGLLGGDDDGGGGDDDDDDGLLCGKYGPEALEGPYPLVTEPHPDQWPTECLADELPFVIVASPEASDEGEYDAVTVTLAGGLLTSFDGLTCSYCDFNEPRSFAPQSFACSQYYVCDDDGAPFRVYMQIINFSTDPRPYWALTTEDMPYRKWILGPAAVPQVEGWQCTPDCADRVCGSDSCGGSCGECPGEGEQNVCVGWQCWPLGDGDGGGGAGGDLCDQCLDGCQGLQQCCTGTGCICRDACMAHDCPEGSRLCCGNDGFCFCTNTCPYW